jgi:hypothetical protein
LESQRGCHQRQNALGRKLHPSPRPCLCVSVLLCFDSSSTACFILDKAAQTLVSILETSASSCGQTTNYCDTIQVSHAAHHANHLNPSPQTLSKLRLGVEVQGLGVSQRWDVGRRKVGDSGMEGQRADAGMEGQRADDRKTLGQNESRRTQEAMTQQSDEELMAMEDHPRPRSTNTLTLRLHQHPNRPRSTITPTLRLGPLPLISQP